MEFSWWAALYAQLGAAHPRTSLALVALVFALAGSGCWALIGADYRRQVKERAQLIPPSDEVLRKQLGDSSVRIAQIETRLQQVDSAIVAEREAKERALAELNDKAKRVAVREALGKFLMRGRDLQQQCGNEKVEPPSREVDEWATEVEKYLGEHLGESYIARFRSFSGLPMSANSNSSIPHRNLWGGLNTRLARLEQFIQEQVGP